MPERSDPHHTQQVIVTSSQGAVEYTLNLHTGKRGNDIEIIAHTVSPNHQLVDAQEIHIHRKSVSIAQSSAVAPSMSVSDGDISGAASLVDAPSKKAAHALREAAEYTFDHFTPEHMKMLVSLGQTLSILSSHGLTDEKTNQFVQDVRAKLNGLVR